MFGVLRFGENSPGWQGGKTEINILVRSSEKYSNWRLLCFQRDNFLCQWCGDGKGGNLQVDHIKPFSLILKENNITTTEQAYNCPELWDINNGRTLCESCHKQTDTWGTKCLKFLKD